MYQYWLLLDIYKNLERLYKSFRIIYLQCRDSFLLRINMSWKISTNKYTYNQWLNNIKIVHIELRKNNIMFTCFNRLHNRKEAIDWKRSEMDKSCHSGCYHTSILYREFERERIYLQNLRWEQHGTQLTYKLRTSYLDDTCQ